MESLKGKLLISAGGLFDAHFRQTVVLVAEHNADGAVGVILNRPLEASVEQAVPPLAALVEPGEHIHDGGPVEPTHPVLLVEVADSELLDLPVFGSIGILTGEVSAEIGWAVLRARVFVGYAGWGPGQLESELERDSWIVEDATEDDVFTDSPKALWRTVLERKGPPYTTMARIPFDPSMN